MRRSSYETLKAMKEVGLRLLVVGFESSDPTILKNIKKGATIESLHLYEALQATGDRRARRFSDRTSW
jgi:radical SAM superfamily enzyme YgiQ (UPF0313 family)